MTDHYHYTECGLDYVWLKNGVDRVDTPYGVGVSIYDVDELHRAIGLTIADQTNQMEGQEMRFLRHELDFSQKALSDFLGVDVQTVARWEKGQTVIPGPAQRLLAGLYREAVTGDSKLTESVKRLAELDAEIHEHLHLALTDDHWTVDAA